MWFINKVEDEETRIIVTSYILFMLYLNCNVCGYLLSILATESKGQCINIKMKRLLLFSQFIAGDSMGAE